MKKKHILLYVIVIFFFFQCINIASAGLTLSYSYNGNSVSITGESNLTTSTSSYRWNISFVDGVESGSTGWVNSTSIGIYKYTFYDESPLSVNLSIISNNTLYYRNIIISSPFKTTKEYESENTSYIHPAAAYTQEDDVIPWVPWVYEREISQFPMFMFMVMVTISIVLIIYINSKRPYKVKIGDYVVYYNKRRTR